MYEESSLERLRRMHPGPELDEMELQLKDVLDGLGVSGREALPKVRAWLDAGGYPNEISPVYRPTTKHVLSGALRHGRVESVRLLLARGARVEDIHFSAAMHGRSPEQRALPCVKLLVSAGADVNKPRGSTEVHGPNGTRVGTSPLMSAISMKKYNVAKYLLSQGADVNYRNVDPEESWLPNALARAHFNANEPYGSNRTTDVDVEFYRFLRSVVAAGSWKLYVRAPRVALVVLRRLCEKEHARPPPELARLFALDKFIFWRVLSFWRSDRDLPPHITTRKTTAPYYYW